jgi:hypothetical protein
MAFDTDFAGIDDLLFDESVSGAAAVAEAFGRRITTRSLWYDPTYVCTDLTSYQSKALLDADLWRIRTDIERCAQAEPRIARAVVTVNWYPTGLELRASIEGLTVDGETFTLTATVDSEGVRLAVAVGP